MELVVSDPLVFLSDPLRLVVCAACGWHLAIELVKSLGGPAELENPTQKKALKDLEVKDAVVALIASLFQLGRHLPQELLPFTHSED